jgi:hypothetical protein
MKLSELTGAALDWAVAKCEGKTKLYQIRRGDSRVIDTDHPEYFEQYKRQHDEYSTDWAQGGPIIEREGISVAMDDVEPWCGFIEDDEINTLFFSGPTPLIAAMRCYVASKMGDEIELPEELK